MTFESDSLRDDWNFTIEQKERLPEGRNGMRRYAWDGTTPERKRKEERAWGEAYREY